MKELLRIIKMHAILNLYINSFNNHKRRGRLPTPVFLGFLCGSAGEESICNAGDLGLIPGLGRSPGGGKGHPLQYSGLENSMELHSPRGHKRVRHNWVTFNHHEGLGSGYKYLSLISRCGNWDTETLSTQLKVTWAVSDRARVKHRPCPPISLYL